MKRTKTRRTKGVQMSKEPTTPELKGMDDDDDLTVVYESYRNRLSTGEDDDDDIQIVYESIDYEEWKMARNILKYEYNIDIETGLPIRPELPNSGNSHAQQIQQPTTPHGTSSNSGANTSRFPPASSKNDATVRGNQGKRARAHTTNSRMSSTTTCSKKKSAGADEEVRVRAFDISMLRQRLKSLASSNKTPEDSRKRSRQEIGSSMGYEGSPSTSSTVAETPMAQRTQRKPLVNIQESSFSSYARP